MIAVNSGAEFLMRFIAEMRKILGSVRYLELMGMLLGSDG
jgi:hypothetical protein